MVPALASWLVVMVAAVAKSAITKRLAGIGQVGGGASNGGFFCYLQP